MERENLDIKYFEDELLKEKARLIKELKSVGRINPDNPNDWEAVPGEKDDGTADKNDYADAIEEFEENTAILKELETELNEVDAALNRIEKKTYGICEDTGEEIAEERLKAYPAARTKAVK